VTTPAATASIRRAAAADLAAVHNLLLDASLPLDGVPADLADFLVATRGEQVVGAVGIERYGAHGLLRSAVVHPDLRGTGLGEALVTALLDAARSSGLRDLTLLTTTAAAWFPRFGFAIIGREAAPQPLHASEEFRGACPASATVMFRTL
jgi:amino-acid N-acetyltransferase